VLRERERERERERDVVVANSYASNRFDDMLVVFSCSSLSSLVCRCERPPSSRMPRQLWFGNLPLWFTESILMDFFAKHKLPVPWKALVREGAGRNAKFAICTFNTVEDTETMMLVSGLKWPDGCFVTIKCL
jgi:hypothetical protein